MRILVTGGFGNVGRSLLDVLIKRKHEVKVIQRPSYKNKKIYRRYKKKIEMLWGDFTDKDISKKSIENIDVIIHLAAVVPPKSEKNREATFAVNVDASKMFIDFVEQSDKKIGFVFGSSMSIMGPTQDKEPPLDHYSETNPTTNYTESKDIIEKYLTKSNIKYCICRIGAVITTLGTFNRGMLDLVFDFPLENRLETILDLDCAVALANAAEQLIESDELHEKILPLGGGKDKGHWIHGKDFTQGMFELMGIGPLDEACYCKEDYFMDWSDTTESQKLLQFQIHTFEESLEILDGVYKKMRSLMKPGSKFIRKGLERMSPYLKENLELEDKNK